jgi:hypothetical protein
LDRGGFRFVDRGFSGASRRFVLTVMAVSFGAAGIRKNPGLASIHACRRRKVQ